MSAQRSIVIGGGAFAGLGLARALRQGLGAGIPIIVADPALAGRPSRDPRATAIVAACRRLFEALGVGDRVAAQAQPILDMVVTDSRLQDATRPVFPTFGGDIEPGEPFAHMVESRHLIDALVKRAAAEGVDLRATSVTTFDSRSDGVDVTLADGSAVEASLLVAADGARSKLRERAGIVTYGWDYDQSGIVVTVGHERDHGGRAEEHFFPAGPFAIPPLTGKRSSLVWAAKRDQGARIGALGQGGCRCGKARHRPRSGRRARTLPALAALRHHGDGACHQLAELLVLERIDAVARGPRYRAGAGRSRAAAEKHVHPPSRGTCRRGAAAIEGRGVVEVIRFVVMPGHTSLPCADCVNLSVMPRIHVLLSFLRDKGVDGRGEPRHDEEETDAAHSIFLAPSGSMS